MTVPEGYEANVIYALGDSINPRVGDWDDNNIPSGPSFQFRSGDCHDGMHYFGLNTSTNRFDETVSAQGLLVMNHEYINQTFLHLKVLQKWMDVALKMKSFVKPMHMGFL